MAGGKCFYCKQRIDSSATGDLAGVKHTNKRNYHAECLEIVLWRKTSASVNRKHSGKAGGAANGRVVKSNRGIS